MSKFSEYLKLIPKGVPHLKQVLKGYVNDHTISSLPKEDREAILSRRLECLKCPHNCVNALTSPEHKEITGSNYYTKREDLHCAFCGCPVNIRTASLESNCGAEYWNKENPNNIVNLKWKAK